MSNLHPVCSFTYIHLCLLAVSAPQEIKITDDGASYELLDRCPVHFELKHQNKGFEGIHYYETEKGDKYLFGLCEGMYA